MASFLSTSSFMNASESADMGHRTLKLRHQGLSKDSQPALWRKQEFSEALTRANDSFAGMSVFLRPPIINNFWALQPAGLQASKRRALAITLNKLITLHVAAPDAADGLQTLSRNDKFHSLPGSTATPRHPHQNRWPTSIQRPPRHARAGDQPPRRAATTRAEWCYEGNRDEIQQWRPAA